MVENIKLQKKRKQDIGYNIYKMNVYKKII